MKKCADALTTSQKIRGVLACVAALCLCGTSCRTVNVGGDDEPVEVVGENVAVVGDISDASILSVSGENIYFTHYASSPLLSKFHLTDDKITLIDRFIPMGSGPYEVQSLILNSKSPNENVFYFSDPNLRKVISYNGVNDSVAVHKLMRDGERVGMLRFAVGHPRGTIITYAANIDKSMPGVVGLISATDSAFIPLKGIGPEEMNNIPISKQYRYAPNSLVFVQPGGGKCLFVSCIGQYAEVFEIAGDQAANKKVLVNNVPPYRLDEHGRMETASDDLKYGFQACVTADKIYLAPLRRTYGEKKAGDIKNNPKYVGAAKGPNFVDELWEFDWNGNPVAEYRLSPGVSSFQVTADGVLYGTSEDDNYDTTLMRYKL